MLDNDEVQQVLSGGGNLVSEDGAKVGSIGQVYLDDQTSQPDWVTVKTGLFGNAESFVPLAHGRLEGTDIRVPFSKAKVKDAPQVSADGHLDQGQEAELYRYYGMTYSNAT